MCKKAVLMVSAFVLFLCLSVQAQDLRPYRFVFGEREFTAGGFEQFGRLYVNGAEFCRGVGFSFDPGKGKIFTIKGRIYRNVIIQDGKKYLDAQVIAGDGGLVLKKKGGMYALIKKNRI